MSSVAVTAGRRSRKIWILPVTALLLAAAVVVPPLVSLNRFHARIAASISRGIGRPVAMSSVKMHLLPRPGFEIADFVIAEDPAFGAEPILRSPQVTAYVRLLSLWRGRLEIARIGLDEPSLNLVRNNQGRWNFDSLLSQAAQVPQAPTAERHPRGLARFPYIDAGNARVNFKFGDEKMPFSLLNADLAVWLANPGEWRIQFAAQPARTDLSLDLANTGILRLEGSLRRAATLTRMPADLHVEWSNAPLGQLSRIFSGADTGWRGQMDATAEITGSADDAQLKVLAKLRGIHRAEFEPRHPLDTDIACQAEFTRVGRSLHAITCLAPTGDGHLLLTGSLQGIPKDLVPELSLEVNHLPVAEAFDGVRLVRSGFAPAIQAAGAIDGNFILRKTLPASSPEVTGHAVVNGLIVAAPAFEKPLTLPPLHFTINEAPAARPAHRPGQPVSSPASSPGTDATLLLEPVSLSPSAVAAGAPSPPLNLSGAFDPGGFRLHIAGQARVGEVLALGREFGLLRSRSVEFTPQGTADLDLSVSGPWLLPVTGQDHPGPSALDGAMRIHNAQLTGAFLAQPLQVGAAQAFFTGNQVRWTASALTYGLVHADGTLTYPAYCEAPPECRRHFTLHIAALDAATAQNAILGASRHGELVQQLLDRLASLNQDTPSWPNLEGTVQIGAVTLQKLAIHDLSASLAIKENSVQIQSLTGHALEGSLQLSGSMNVAAGTPAYEIEARLDNASIAAAAGLFDEKWGPGTIDLAATLNFAGFEPARLLSSMTGSYDWDWARGALPLETAAIAREASAGPAPPAPVDTLLSHFDHWVASGTIAASTLTLDKSAIESAAQAVPFTGTISFHRELNLASPDRSNTDHSSIPAPIQITGTLQHPQVAEPPASVPPQTAP